MIIITNDGYTFKGEDAKEIVRQMRDTQWGTPVLKREYMEEVKDRVGNSTTFPIIHDKGADAFLESLSVNDLIQFVNDNVDDERAYHDDQNKIARETEYNEQNSRYEPDPRD